MGNKQTNLQELEQSNKTNEVKIAMIGGIAAGKATILHRYLTGKFISQTYTNIGVAVHFKNVTFDEEPVKLVICDIQTQRSDELFKFHMKNAKFLIIVYDITNTTTYNEIQGYIQTIADNTSLNNTLIGIVGNKCDLNYLREIEFSNVVSMAQKFPNIIFVAESSAKQDINVENIFTAALCAVRKVGSSERKKFIPEDTDNFVWMDTHIFK